MQNGAGISFPSAAYPTQESQDIHLTAAYYYQVSKSTPASLSVVELRGDPGQPPFQIGEHKLQRLGPLLLRVKLGFDGVGASAATCILNLPLLHIHPERWWGKKHQLLL